MAPRGLTSAWSRQAASAKMSSPRLGRQRPPDLRGSLVNGLPVTTRPRYTLAWAAVPAVALSAWLMSLAGAPHSALSLQVVVAGVAAAAFVALSDRERMRHAGGSHWLALAMALSLFVPMLNGAEDGPQRWLVLGSTRVYLAPVVLPTALLLLGATLRSPATFAMSVVGVASALALQPDAAQLTAFATAMLVLLPSLRSHRLLVLALSTVLLCCAVVAWRRPDPLEPVRYVEGVFSLAADVSPFALTAALIAAALPVVAFVRVARVEHSRGAFAVAVYYACLFALAPLQVTPVPLLGFGAGPILGYFLVAGAASREVAA